MYKWQRLEIRLQNSWKVCTLKLRRRVKNASALKAVVRDIIQARGVKPRWRRGMAVAKEWNEDCSVGDRRGQIYASLPVSDWSSEIILFQSGLTKC